MAVINGGENTGYAKEVLPLVRQQFNVRKLFNTEYEGDIKSGIITVPVAPADPTVKTYNVRDGIELEKKDFTYKKITADEDMAINELLDGYETNKVPANVVAQRLEAGAYSLGLSLEKKAIEEITKKGNKTLYEDVTPLTDKKAYKTIINMVKELTKKGFSKLEMTIIVSPDTQVALLTDELYARSSSQLADNLKTEGIIGRINGVNVVESNLLPEEVEIIVFVNKYAHAGDVFRNDVKINPIMNGKHIGASALQGRCIPYHAVTNPEAILVKMNKPEQ